MKKNLFLKKIYAYFHSKKMIEFIISFFLTLFIILLIYFAFMNFLPLLHQVSASGGSDEEAVMDYLKNRSGLRGLTSLGALQILQVITIFFPGAAVQIAGGLLYGTWKSFLVCYSSFVFGNSMIFYLSRHNVSLLKKIIVKDNRNFLKISRWLNSSEPAFMAMLAYMLPGLPNGFIPYVAAKTNITMKHFVLAVLFGSCFQVFIMCSLGHQLLQGHWIISVILMFFSVTFIILLYRNKNRIIQIRKNWRGN